MHVLTIIALALIAIILFGLIIFLHELGHFITAKLFKVRVNEFAIGMGPTLLKFQKGETQYSLKLLPIGGYCAMEGEDEASNDNRAFGNKPVWQRMIIIVAGAMMNIIFGIILMFTLMVQKDTFVTTQIGAFTENSAIEAAGIQVGDTFSRIDGYKIYTDRDLTFALGIANPDSVDIEVERDGKTLLFPDTKLNTLPEQVNGKKIVQLDFKVFGVDKSAGLVLSRSVKETFSMVRMVIETLKGMLTGRFGLNEMAGPIGTAQVITQAAGQGLQQSFGSAVNNIVLIIILITVNLGVVNLLPIPALDGGRFLFLLVELIIRKPVPQKYEGAIHTIGFVLLMGFTVFIAASDIYKIVTGVTI
ncbi:M50 family metallopeptidase [Scatolibacter rhodanostii]|uniref:M50 family metallopeptidase n=1 Tax=Scatolibacter rhodanostii TaxID=2014781 RepID=UPI000C0739E8|nr:M50 family metallopeptidase [Scatolibacter rhodanostii]